MGDLVVTEKKKIEEEEKMKDYKVKGQLFRAIGKITFEQVLDRSDSKVIWDSLKLKFGGNERVKQSLLNTLRRDFEVLEMKK